MNMAASGTFLSLFFFFLGDRTLAGFGPWLERIHTGRQGPRRLHFGPRMEPAPGLDASSSALSASPFLRQLVACHGPLSPARIRVSTRGIFFVSIINAGKH